MCRHFLAAEITLLRDIQVVVALGRIAFDAILRSYPPITGAATLVFAHNAASSLGPGLPMLVTSYHPSRQNTQTGRLTTGMFDDVWVNVQGLLE